MRAQRAKGIGSATVVDLRARPAKARTVSVRRRRSSHWTILVVEGEMDIQVLPALADVDSKGAVHVVFVLSAVTFLDAAALGALVGLQRRALRAGGCVRLVAPSRSVRRLLLLTGTSRVFCTFDELGQALSAPVPTGPERAW